MIKIIKTINSSDKLLRVDIYLFGLCLYTKINSLSPLPEKIIEKSSSITSVDEEPVLTNSKLEETKKEVNNYINAAMKYVPAKDQSSIKNLSKERFDELIGGLSKKDIPRCASYILLKRMCESVFKDMVDGMKKEVDPTTPTTIRWYKNGELYFSQKKGRSYSRYGEEYNDIFCHPTRVMTRFNDILKSQSDTANLIICCILEDFLKKEYNLGRISVIPSKK